MSRIILNFSLSRHSRQYGSDGMYGSNTGQNATAGLPHTTHLHSLAFIAVHIIRCYKCKTFFNQSTIIKMMGVKPTDLFMIRNIPR